MLPTKPLYAVCFGLPLVIVRWPSTTCSTRQVESLPFLITPRRLVRESEVANTHVLVLAKSADCHWLDGHGCAEGLIRTDTSWLFGLCAESSVHTIRSCHFVSVGLRCRWRRSQLFVVHCFTWPLFDIRCSWVVVRSCSRHNLATSQQNQHCPPCSRPYFDVWRRACLNVQVEET